MTKHNVRYQPKQWGPFLKGKDLLYTSVKKLMLGKDIVTLCKQKAQWIKYGLHDKENVEERLAWPKTCFLISAWVFIAYKNYDMYNYASLCSKVKLRKTNKRIIHATCLAYLACKEHERFQAFV